MIGVNNSKVSAVCQRCLCCFLLYDMSSTGLTLTANTTWFSPCCTGGLCGATGADYSGDVYSKPQCHRKTSVPGLSL